MPRYKPLGDDIVTLIMKKHEKGKTADEIAKMLEISKLRVNNVLRRATLDVGVKEIILKAAQDKNGAPLNYIAETAQTRCKDKFPDVKITPAMINQVLVETGWKKELNRRVKCNQAGRWMTREEYRSGKW